MILNVRELIEALSKCDGNAHVHLEHIQYDDQYDTHGYGVENALEKVVNLDNRVVLSCISEDSEYDED